MAIKFAVSKFGLKRYGVKKRLPGADSLSSKSESYGSGPASVPHVSITG